MKTIGIDFAAQPENTAACGVDWANSRAVVLSVVQPADNDDLRLESAKVDRVGVDVPLGWPDEFVTAVAGHRDGKQWPSVTSEELRLRRTDRFIHEKIEKWPLSVSTDKIGIAAFRAARLAPQLAGTERVDRTGQGKLVEVYPAAALRRWELGPATKADTAALFDALQQRTSGWLQIPDAFHHALKTSRDALDALICALIARAAALGQCEPIPPDALASAKREGWIALPMTGSLARLAQQTGGPPPVKS